MGKLVTSYDVTATRRTRIDSAQLSQLPNETSGSLLGPNLSKDQLGRYMAQNSSSLNFLPACLSAPLLERADDALGLVPSVGASTWHKKISRSTLWHEGVSRTPQDDTLWIDRPVRLATFLPTQTMAWKEMLFNALMPISLVNLL